MPPTIEPTDLTADVAAELERWSRAYAGDEYIYGDEPGPVARRAVRYHGCPPHASALDLGCGEGQDLAWLASRGYRVTGVEFVADAAKKASRLLRHRGEDGEVIQQDLRSYLAAAALQGRTWDLVLAVNSLQFTGADAEGCLELVPQLVSPGGVLGLSLFAREPHQKAVTGTVAFFSVEDVLNRFAGWQRLEAAHLWQWNTARDVAQPFVTVIARNHPPSRSGMRFG